MPSGAAATLRANLGALDQSIWSGIPVEYSIFTSAHPRYSNYAMVNTELVAEGHNGTHSTTDMKFDPSGLGDVWGPTRAMFALPSIIRNTSAGALLGRENDAYYCQSVGFAMFDRLILKIGSQEAATSDHRALYDHYQLYSPMAEADIDADVGRYQTESQLKRAAAGNQILMVPLNMATMRNSAPHRHLVLARLFAQQVRLVMRLRSLAGITCNLHDVTSIPYLKGGSTVLASANIGVRVFSKFFILDDIERDNYAYSPQKSIILQSQSHLKENETTTSGRTITETVLFNHAVRCLKIGHIPDSYTDGTTYSPNSVGIKNYFDYAPSHGGETFYAINLKFNSAEIIDNKIPPVILRSHNWQECYGKRPYSHLYLVPFQLYLNNEQLNHTVNFSGIDKAVIECKKNETNTGTFFIITDSGNVMATENGFGGVPFGG